MTYSVVLGEHADVDLREIFDYIAFTLRSADHAFGQLDRLEDAISKLNHNPKRFRLYEREPWRSRGLRRMPVDQFCVFYIPNDEISLVTIIRVMYEGRDADAHLRNDAID